MIELYLAQARISQLRREAAAYSLANSVPVTPKPVRERRALSAGEVELRMALAQSITGWA